MQIKRKYSLCDLDQIMCGLEIGMYILEISECIYFVFFSINIIIIIFITTSGKVTVLCDLDQYTCEKTFSQSLANKKN